MKTGNLFRAISLAIGIGFAVGLAGAVFFVLVNRYITYRMFRLAALTLQRYENTTVPLFAAVVLGLYALFVLWLRVGKPDNNRFLRPAVMVILGLTAVMVVRWSAIPLHSLPWWIQKLGRELWNTVRGETSLGAFIALVKNRLAAGAILIGSVGALIALWWCVKRADWAGILGLLAKRRSERMVVPVIVLLVVLNVGLAIDKRLNAPDSPSVLLIGIDTWRADHVGAYGYIRDTTPSIDRMAEQGARFRNAFSTTSWTLPSFHSILTGLYQGSHGVIDGQHRLAHRYNTFAEVLRERGYTTAGFISGTYLKRVFGFDQGFDVYEESVTSASLMETYSDVTSPDLTEIVLPWIERNKARRFFLFIHYWDPHFDYIPPPPYDEMFDPLYQGDIDGTDFLTSDRVNPEMDRRDLEHIIALYDGEIRWTDWHIDRLFTKLEDLGLMSDMIVILVGDHGEEFFEHGLKGHRSTLYNEVIHVPLILRGPGVPPSTVFDSPVSTTDILPTVLAVLGLASPTPVDGESLIPIVSGKAGGRESSTVVSELGYGMTAIVKGQWKLIHDSALKTYELYDLGSDPRETENLLTKEASKATELEQDLLAWLRITRSRKITAPRALRDEATIRELKSLGYIQ